MWDVTWWEDPTSPQRLQHVCLDTLSRSSITLESRAHPLAGESPLTLFFMLSIALCALPLCHRVCPSFPPSQISAPALPLLPFINSHCPPLASGLVFSPAPLFPLSLRLYLPSWICVFLSLPPLSSPLLLNCHLSVLCVYTRYFLIIRRRFTPWLCDVWNVVMFPVSLKILRGCGWPWLGLAQIHFAPTYSQRVSPAEHGALTGSRCLHGIELNEIPWLDISRRSPNLTHAWLIAA